LIFDAPTLARLAFVLLRSPDKTDEQMHSDLAEFICYTTRRT
jgi:hypothetical protein